MYEVQEVSLLKRMAFDPSVLGKKLSIKKALKPTAIWFRYLEDKLRAKNFSRDCQNNFILLINSGKILIRSGKLKQVHITLLHII